MVEFSRVYKFTSIDNNEALAIFKTDGLLIEVIEDLTDGAFEQMCKGDFIRLLKIVAGSSRLVISEIFDGSDNSTWNQE